MREYIIFALVVALSWVLGFIFARIFTRHKANGTIVIAMSEDGEREQIRFILDMDLDDIKNKKELILTVENHVSQNSQTV